MFSKYVPCSFFDEPIITSHGVIFGMETNGDFITGNLPRGIQAAYIRNNQVPYMPFTNIHQNSPSYVTDKQRMEAYNKINFPAISTTTSHMALTFNTPSYTSNSPLTLSMSSPPTSTPTPTPTVHSPTLMSREQELDLESTIMKKTGLNPMTCKTIDEYKEVTKQIKQIVQSSISNGIDYAVVEYNSSIVSKTKPTYENTPVPAPVNTLNNIRNRLGLIQRSDIYSTLGDLTETDVESTTSNSSVSDDGSFSDSDDNSSIYTDSDNNSDNSDNSDNYNLVNDTHITDVACVINYVNHDGKRYYIMGMNSNNLYSLVTQKVHASHDNKESCITSLTKLLNTHFPSINIIINKSTHYNDKKISGKSYRIYQIYVNAFDMNDNNLKVRALKTAGINVNFTNFKLISTDNTIKTNIDKRELNTINGEQIKIDYVTKNIFSA
jgi:hypothetical protein